MVLFKPADVIRGLDRAVISYYLSAQPKSLTIDFLDAKGQVMRSVTGLPPAKPGETRRAVVTVAVRSGPQGAPMAAGVNRYSWDLNSTLLFVVPRNDPVGRDAERPDGAARLVSVRLTADGVTQTQPFSSRKHPLRPFSDADLQYQWDLASRIRDKVNEANLAVINIRRIKTDIAARTKEAPKEVQDAGRSWPCPCRRLKRTSTRCGTRAGRIRSTSPSRPTIGWHRCCASR